MLCDTKRKQKMRLFSFTNTRLCLAYSKMILFLPEIRQICGRL
ncbi:hypothetical protein HMPREF1870_01307 [Bacteroidales bacterium KA00344]|nr:hypothetical protein HMPREF1870_01307 [Bacteroidales bacterium KA00344]